MMPWAIRLLVSMIVLGCPLLSACERGPSNEYQTCTICDSTRVVNARTGEQILYRSPRFAHGEHAWRAGISLAVHDPVSSGVVVLVRRIAPDSGQVKYGALILTKQSPDPERVSYRWYLRSDGSGLFDADAAVRSGDERDQKRITFGPFRIAWSGSTDSTGYLYYDNFAHNPAKKDTTYICVTSEKDVTGINAADPKWIYRFSLAE